MPGTLHNLEYKMSAAWGAEGIVVATHHN